MDKTKFPFGLLLACVIIVCSSGADWGQFRGNDNRNTTDCSGLPLSFDQKTGENIAWTADLPGRGPSSPIVVGDQVIVTCSSGHRRDRLYVLAFDKNSGKCNWRQPFWATGHTLLHPMGDNAQPTPASDGKSIFAFYSSNDLACFDLQGNMKWFRGLAYDYPFARNDAGMASSPLVVGPTVIVQIQNQGESFVAGIDTETGETRWRIPRERFNIWSSPTILPGKSATHDDDLFLLQDRGSLTAHDPRTGKEVCRYEAECHTISSVTTGDGEKAGEGEKAEGEKGSGTICRNGPEGAAHKLSPTPFHGPEGAAHKLSPTPFHHDADRNRPNVYLPANGLHALRVDPASAKAECLWYERRMRSNNTSPVIHNGRAYTINSSGVLTCGDIVDGKVLWQLRLKGPFWATPLVGDTHLYAVNYDGAVHVVALGEKGKLLRTCQFDSKILASPIAVDGAIYLRSDAHLMKVAMP